MHTCNPSIQEGGWQEAHHEFEACLGYILRSCLKLQSKTRGGASPPQGPCYSPAISPVNHVQVLQSSSNVMWAHACGSANGLDADVSLMMVVEIFQDDTFPVSQVGESAQIRKWLFRRPCLAFSSRKQIAQGRKSKIPLILGVSRAKSRSHQK